MIMEYTGRHTVVTPKLRTIAEAGMSRVALVANRCSSAHFILTEDKYRKIAEVRVQCRNDSLVVLVNPLRWRRRSGMRCRRWNCRQFVIRNDMRRCAIAPRRFPRSSRSSWHPASLVSEDARPLMVLRFPHEAPHSEGLRQGEEAPVKARSKTSSRERRRSSDVEPRELVILTGLSGSGKASG